MATSELYMYFAWKLHDPQILVFPSLFDPFSTGFCDGPELHVGSQAILDTSLSFCILQEDWSLSLANFGFLT